MTNQRPRCKVNHESAWDSKVVRTVKGTAILTGTVGSWGERDSAVAAAWATPGVIEVDDRLELFYY